MKKISIILIIALQSVFAFAQEDCTNHPQIDITLKPDLDTTTINPVNSDRLVPHGLQARSGGWSGNGGDFGEVNDNIWFLGSEQINYCMKSSKSFPLSISAQERLIESSFVKWKAFYAKYDLLNSLTGSSQANTTSKISFPDKVNRSINFNYKFVQDCKQAKLIFHFGVENKIISEYKKYATEHPYGFALRKSYDHQNYMNTGLVWIKEIQDTKKIEHTLLHEIGHVLGMKHDSVYIMRSKMAQELEESKDNFKIINKIETTAWPYRFKDGSSIFVGLPKRAKRRGDKACKTENAFKLGKDAKLFKPLISASADDCVTFEIKSNQSSMRRSSMELDLKITNLNNKKVKVFHGVFGAMRKTLRKKKGPGVFTKLHMNGRRGVKEVWRKIYLDKSGNNEISGSFKSRFKTIPSKLTQEKGAILDLYLSQSNKWISLKSYH